MIPAGEVQKQDVTATEKCQYIKKDKSLGF